MSRPSPLQKLSDFQLKDTKLPAAAGQKPGAFDLVEKMEYLFVRVVKARDLPAKDITGSLDPYVEVLHGNFKCVTKHLEKNQNPEWSEVFAIPRDQVQSSSLDVEVKDKDLVSDDFVGRVQFDLNEVPVRAPPDSPLAPEWYRLQDKKGQKLPKGEVMLAVWYGTQADEAFPYATHSVVEPAIDPRTLSVYNRAKVYHAPRLWYLRINIIDAHDIYVPDKSRVPEVLCKARLGGQMMKTNAIKSRSLIFRWNEEFMFVAAEPFEENIILSVENRVSPGKDEVIGEVRIPFTAVDKRPDARNVRAKWHELRRPVAIDVDQLKEDKFASRIQARLSLDGGYHVCTEPAQYASDVRPTEKSLWKKPIGVLELGILRAEALLATKTRDGKGACDAYCVAKYGHKWVRTRTAVGDLSPKFNEQYTWDVYDHGTVLTVGVFDNGQLGEGSGNRDSMIGKVRVRLSTLETGRIYANSYPLHALQSSGVKMTGQLHLAIRFSATSAVGTLLLYARPQLPKMHYTHPLTQLQQTTLRRCAVDIVAARLGRMEPPLRREVVGQMLDMNVHFWSMRRSRANVHRLLAVAAPALAAWRWFRSVCAWTNPVTTVLVHVLFLMLVSFPQMILFTAFFYSFVVAVWTYRFRPRKPQHMDAKLSLVEQVNLEELDEELDTSPSSRGDDMVRIRYDNLRGTAMTIAKMAGDIATHGERLQQLLSWRDPRATFMFMVFCLLAAAVLYLMPFEVVEVFAGFYVMRHPKFRHRMPSRHVNFFRRLPARTDSLL